MLSLPSWLGTICIPMGVSLALWVAQQAGKLCHRIPSSRLAIPLGVVAGVASAFGTGFLAGRLIFPVEFFGGAVFVAAFSAFGGSIVGGCAACGLDLGVEVSSGGDGDSSVVESSGSVLSRWLFGRKRGRAMAMGTASEGASHTSMATVTASESAAHTSPDGRIVVSETPDGLEFRPVRLSAEQKATLKLALAIVVGLLAVLVSTPIAVPLMFIAHVWVGAALPMWLFITLCVSMIGGLGLAAGVSAWRFEADDEPLIVHRSGRVTRGTQVILEPGATRRVYIERVRLPDSDGEAFAVASENRWGALVRFETFFGAFATHAAAYWFAIRLGRVIGAEVVPAEPGGELS